MNSNELMLLDLDQLAALVTMLSEGAPRKEVREMPRNMIAERKGVGNA